MKKSFSIILVAWIAVLAVFPGSFVFAQTSCSSFNTASYTVPGGASTFLINTDISTNLAIKAKTGVGRGVSNVDVVMIIDRSGSMRSGDGGSSQTKIAAAKDSMNALVDILEKENNPKNRVALITFAGDATTNLSFTNDYNAMRVAIKKVLPTPGSGTSIGNGLYEGGAILKSAGLAANTSRFVILASDGVHNTGKSISTGKANIPEDATVYTIGIGTPSYLDEPAMKDIAHNTGAKNGEYFQSAVPELVGIFQSIIKSIIASFTLRDISLSFSRDDTVYTDFTGTLPTHDSYDSTNGIIKWSTIGNFLSGQTKNIKIDYKGTKIGRNIPLNTSSLRVRYTKEGVSCTEDVPVNVLSIAIADTVPPLPECTGSSWEPSASTVCSTQILDQTNNCGDTQTVAGTKACTQCSDGIDNDEDGFIDYPSDRGCDSPQDDNEKNYFFRFFEF